MKIWGYSKPRGEILGKHTNSFSSGHPWLPLANLRCIPIQLISVLLKSVLCSLFF